jgi:hypothetical protein
MTRLDAQLFQTEVLHKQVSVHQKKSEYFHDLKSQLEIKQSISPNSMGETQFEEQARNDAALFAAEQKTKRAKQLEKAQSLKREMNQVLDAAATRRLQSHQVRLQEKQAMAKKAKMAASNEAYNIQMKRTKKKTMEYDTAAANAAALVAKHAMRQEQREADRRLLHKLETAAAGRETARQARIQHSKDELNKKLDSMSVGFKKQDKLAQEAAVRADSEAQAELERFEFGKHQQLQRASKEKQQRIATLKLQVANNASKRLAGKSFEASILADARQADDEYNSQQQLAREKRRQIQKNQMKVYAQQEAEKKAALIESIKPGLAVKQVNERIINGKLTQLMMLQKQIASIKDATELQPKQKVGGK